MKEKDKILDLLDDPEIQNKIRRIVSEEESTNDRRELQLISKKRMYSENEVQSEILSARSQWERELVLKQKKLVEECNLKIEAQSKQLAEMESKMLSAINEKESLKTRYATMEFLYLLYLQFEPQELKWFDKVLHEEKKKAESPLELVVWATQKENLTAMWEVISCHVNELERSGKVKNFADFFEICFGLYAMTAGGKAVLVKPGVGEFYDPMKYDKTTESHAAGVIEEVVLPGYTIGRESCKAVVRV